MKGEKGPPPIPTPSSPPVYTIYRMCFSISARFKKKKPLIDGAYRGRDIGDSEIDELSKLQGVEVVPNKDQP